MFSLEKRINALSLWLAEKGNKIASKSVSHFADGLIPIDQPPNDSPEELDGVIRQHSNNFSPKIMADDLDEKVEQLFDGILTDNGHRSSLEHIEGLSKEIVPIIRSLKSFFNRPRPSEYALGLGIGWSGDDSEMKTVDSPSYPSGHTAQAYYIAHNLAAIHPDLSEELFGLAELVAQSRVDRGVHYPSDLDGGRELAKHLFEN